MIERFYTTNFSVRRMVWSGDSSSEQSIESFMGHIQQAAAELSESMGLSFSKAFTIWCPVDTDIEDGDAVTDGEWLYTVKAVRENKVGINQHLEVVVERREEYYSV